MTKYIIIVFFWGGVSTENLFGQTTPIQLDRPDQTECPFIVPTRYIQLENGFTFENTNSKSHTLNYPSTLWKYGLNERFEFRLITEFITEKKERKSITGLNPITIGFKVNICQEKGIIPIISLIGHLTTAKVGKKDFLTTFTAPSFRFTMQHTLSNKVSLAYNIGAEWNGETAEPTSIYTLTTGIALTNKLGSYVEVYGFLPKNDKADHRFDCGFTYLVNNNFMIDLSGGFGLTENAPKNYVSLGISYRFKTTK